MKLALVGVGGAGVRIVDRMIEREVETGRNFCNGNVLAFDTAQQAFEEVDHLPEEHQALFGDVSPKVGEDGVGGNPDLGADVAREDVHEIGRAFDTLDFTEVDGALLVAGLGGGTGGGSGAVLIEELQAICEKPVYALGVLPEADAPDHSALTAARSLQSFVKLADNVILFDNETWRSALEAEDGATDEAEDDANDDDVTGERDDQGDVLEYDENDVASDDPIEDGHAEGRDDEDDEYDAINDVVASYAMSLLGAGELEPITIAENRVDASDLARTLETGGVSSIGQATVDLDRNTGVLWSIEQAVHDLERKTGVVSSIDRAVDDLDRRTGLISWLSGAFPSDLVERDDGPEPTDAAKVKRAVRNAIDEDLTVPCAVDSAHRAVVVLSGPPTAVSRKGFESARYWLEQETDTVEVLAGDEPRRRASTLQATVLLSNVTEVPRIDEIQERAVRAKDELEDAERVESEDGEFRFA